jgi:hypothetical protein
MKTMRTILLTVSVALLGACGAGDSSDPASGGTLYMDMHQLGPGKVTAAAVAEAHQADLKVQDAHGVSFLRYWVDEANGVVYCLAEADSPDAIVAAHREAHGLIPQTVGEVTAGE